MAGKRNASLGKCEAARDGVHLGMAPDERLSIAPGLDLPRSELEFRASRSGGPGGQHVNTSSTRVEVWWDIARLADALGGAASSA